MQKELLIPIAELRSVVMECAQCRSQIIFDVTFQPPESIAGRRASATPAICPTCDSHFDSGIQRAVDLFRSAYMAMPAGPSNAKLLFRVALDAPSPAAATAK